MTSDAAAAIRNPAATLFAALWALATLFHIVAQPGPLTEALQGNPAGLQTALVAASALWLLQRPTSERRLLLLAALQVVNATWLLPYIPNHWMIGLFVNLCLLLTAAARLVTGRLAGRAAPVVPGAPTSLVELSAPMIRVVLLLAYAFAAFSKLNRDFLFSSSSCAADFSAMLLRNLGLAELGGKIWSLLPALGTAGIEAAIPLLLLISRTRPFGIALGLAFHFLLVLDPLAITYDFTSALYALFFLFLPASAAPALEPLVFLVGPSARARALRRALALFVALLLLGAAAGEVPWLAVSHLTGRKVLWLAYAAVVLLSFYRLAKRSHWWLEGGFGEAPIGSRNAADLGRAAGRLALVPLAGLPVVLLVLLNGLSPYLGIKTGTSFTMYSNLRTEGGVSNHLLVRRTLELSGNTSDLIEPLASSHPKINNWAQEGVLVPRFELRRLLNEDPEATLRYRRYPGGSERVLQRHRDEDRIAERLPGWQERLLIYRPLDQLGEVRCRW